MALDPLGDAPEVVSGSSASAVSLVNQVMTGPTEGDEIGKMLLTQSLVRSVVDVEWPWPLANPADSME
jgi:hypothetical protein